MKVFTVIGCCFLVMVTETTEGKPKPESSLSSLAPGPFGALDNVKPPRPSSNEPVLVPPDIKYWAYGKVNTTVVDAGGLPWYCYTYRQTHCRPLFNLPAKWRTTRGPFVSQNPARSTTQTPRTTTRPPVTIVRTNVDGDDIPEEGVKISNRGRKLVGHPTSKCKPMPMPMHPASLLFGYSSTQKRPNFG